VHRRASFCLEKPFSGYANFTERRLTIYGQDARMKVRMSTVLRFWVDVECGRIKNHRRGHTRTEVIAQILRKFEETGDAMRLRSRGAVVDAAQSRGKSPPS
jgi:hypothetical protein